MNRHVNAIAGRLSLRQPQKRSLEILDRVTEIAPPKKDADVAAALAAIRSEYPTVTDFEREFPSLCFALATGVGKTRLMGAFISYLYLAHDIKNFFVLAPNLTIYNKLIADFTPNTSKYVFKGISEFAVETPEIITGDDYEAKAGTLFDQPERCKVNIFNISKINSEVRGGKPAKIKRMAEYIGESYFDYLAGLPDLVLLMDESHRYRASAGIRAINELKPILGLELTATPKVETPKGIVNFKNIILDYPLGKAIEDGFVKNPAVVTRLNFNPAGMSPDEIERLKLEDGIRLHESVKVELETYARETGNKIVKPFLLAIARDTNHAGKLLQLVQSEAFFEGRYKTKVIQVDSSQTGEAEDEMVKRLLAVESPDEPTEIVIHVNMLKEGWDVTNLYTIVPLRAANAKILVEQSIGRGLRLPYGKRTGVESVDRLYIVAHDKFQEIVDEANKPDSAIRLQTVIMSADQLEQKTVMVVSQSNLSTLLGLQPDNVTPNTATAEPMAAPAFINPEEQKISQIAYQVIRKLETQPQKLPCVAYLMKPEIQQFIKEEVEAQCSPAQLELAALPGKTNFAAIVAKTAELVAQGTIDIPRIQVVPKGKVKSGYNAFSLDLTGVSYPPVSEELWVHHLLTNKGETLSVGRGTIQEPRLEDYVVSGLIEFDDVAYDDHADLLYDLAGQVVRHFQKYLSPEDTQRVLQCHQRDIARFVHAQMQQHYWEKATGYDVVVSRGFTELKPCAYSVSANEPRLDFNHSPADKSNWNRYLFGGFKHCLYPVLKFQAEAERKLAVILDRESLKWFRPNRGQFQIYYKLGSEQPEYQPDFVAETKDTIFMLEPKSRDELDSPEVQAKKDAAEAWCKNATDHARSYEGKPWKYVLIPHDIVSVNMDIDGLVKGTRNAVI